MNKMKYKPYSKYKDSGVETIGEIPIHWNIKKIKYPIEIIGGNGFPEELQGIKEGDYPFYKVSSINSQEKYVQESENYVIPFLVRNDT